MKRNCLIITALSALLLLAGCSKSEPSHKEPTDGVIRLSSGIRVTVGSKAAVGNADRFTAQVCGWTGDGIAAPTDKPEWINIQEFTATTTVTPFDLTPLRYYDNDGVTATTICAWYPQGDPESGLVSFENTNGDVDVMCTQRVWGSLSQKISQALVFEHLTTQLCFKVVGDNWNPEEKIVSITVRDVELPVGLVLPKDAGVPHGTLQKGAPAHFSLRHIPSEFVPAEQIKVAGDALMIAPINSKVLYIDIVTMIGDKEKRYEKIPVTTTDDSYAAGTAYTATLTFTGQGNGIITVGSTVDEWQPGVADGEIVD